MNDTTTHSRLGRITDALKSFWTSQVELHERWLLLDLPPVPKERS